MKRMQKLLYSFALTTALVPLCALANPVTVPIREQLHDEETTATKTFRLNVVPSKTDKHFDVLMKKEEDRRAFRMAKKAGLPPKAKATPVIPDHIDLSISMMAIQDQGELGSCTAHATQGLVDVEYRQRNLVSLPLSRLFQYAGSRVEDNAHAILSQGKTGIMKKLADDSGATIAASVATVLDFGTVPETFYPYNTTNFKNIPDGHLFYLAKLYGKILPVSAAPVTQSIEGIKARLAKGKSVIIGMSCYEGTSGILSATAARTGFVGMPAATDKPMGGHAVLIVGYDDRTTVNGKANPYHGYFKVRNSWSTHWGDKGYFYLPTSYVIDPNITWEMWSFVTTADPSRSKHELQLASHHSLSTALASSLSFMQAQHEEELEALKEKNKKLKEKLKNH